MSNVPYPAGTGDPLQASIGPVPGRLVVGLAVRASNATESTADPGAGPIGQLWGAFAQQGFLQDIPNQAQPGEIVCLYTDYDSDQDGEYLALLGRAVTSLDSIPEGMTGKLIPAQTMAAIAVDGDLQTTIPATWERALATFTPDYRLRRTFTADLDVYPVDAPSSGPTGTILIGISPPAVD